MEVVELGGIYKTEIRDMGLEGEEIGHINGRAIFVPGGVTGDFIEVEVVEIKKKILKGRIIEIISPSPFRTSPPCSYFSECGGCDLQNMTYEGQLKFKKKRVIDALERIGGLRNPLVQDVIGMEDPWYYRNKIVYSVDGHKISFMKKKSHEVMDCQSCMIQDKVIDKVLEELRREHREGRLGEGFGEGLGKETREGAGEGLREEVKEGLRRITVKSSFSTGETMVILDVKGEKIIHSGGPLIRDKLLGLVFEISPESFYQVNPIQTEKLYKKVGEYCELKGEEVVLDLYCGVGTIGLTLASKAKKIIGIESVRDAVNDGKMNALINGIENAEFIVGKAEDELGRLIEGGVKADIIILDPPRAGCEKRLLESVIEAKPEKIIYVSCDPATMARDIKILTANGFAFVEGQPVDMFPQTTNVECVILMRRSG